VRGGVLILFGLLLAVAAMLPDRPARGDAGATVPRFMSVKNDPARVRRGPSREHEILWVYQDSPLPVEIVADIEGWSRIRDWDGDEGWMAQSLLTSRRSAMIVGSNATLRTAPDDAAPPVAIAEPGVVASLLACEGDWCEVEIENHDGWVSRGAIWGVYPDEEFGEED
jgi:SH3-like domain-containing protein